MPKKSPKVLQIVTIDGENLHIFWTTWGTSVKCLGKMWLLIILQVTKNQGFTFSLEDKFLKKVQGTHINPHPQPFKGNHIVTKSKAYWLSTRSFCIKKHYIKTPFKT